MVAEQRDSNGRLRVPYFINLIGDYMSTRSTYNAAEFKLFVERLGVLQTADWEPESNGYTIWKHRVDRARQKVFTDV